MLISDNCRTAQPMAGMGGFGMGGLGAMGYLGQLGNLHAALTAEERKAKQAAAHAAQVAKHAEAVAAQHARVGNRQAAAQAKQVAAQAKHASNQATQAAKVSANKAAQVKKHADQVAKKAALKQKRLLGKTITANDHDSALIDRMSGPMTDAQNSIQSAMAAAKKALASRNQSDKNAAISAAQTASQKLHAVMGDNAAPPKGLKGFSSGGLSGMLGSFLGALFGKKKKLIRHRAMNGFGDLVTDPNTGITTDTTTGQQVDPVTGQPIGGTTAPYIDPATGQPYNPIGTPSYPTSGNYGLPPPGTYGADPTGIFQSLQVTPIQTPVQCQRNPSKAICLQFQMQQQTQQQMQMVFGLLQNMFAQLMDLINTLLQQNFQTQQTAVAQGQYAGGIPPYGSPYGSPYGDPYGQYGGAPGIPYAGGGGDVSAIPPGYDVGGADMYGGVPADVNASYTSAGPGAGVGPYGSPQFGPQAAPDQGANIISSDGPLPFGADTGSDMFGGGDASEIAPPSIFAASSASYGIPPPPQQQAPVQYYQQQPMYQPPSASVSQGPAAQMVMAQPGPVFAQQQPIYDDGSADGGALFDTDGMPLYSQQPAGTWPQGASDSVPGGIAPPNQNLYAQLQLQPPGAGDELAVGDEGGDDSGNFM